MSPEAHQQAAADRTDLRRVAQPADIANVIAFLVSADAAFVTGQTVYATGSR
jgi:NAD(P)-dependent dehydrogenase (short-subunit alcohol dehydrogenase family)